jgi:hypothetical protein
VKREDEQIKDDDTVSAADTGGPDGARGSERSYREDRPLHGPEATPVRGAKTYVLDLLGEGRISASRAAHVLAVSVHRVHELAREQRVEIGATGEDYRRSTETFRGFL